MIDRRTFLRLTAGLAATGLASAVYGVLVEPLLRTRLTRYSLTPPGWPADLRLRLAVIADLHACNPWMSADRVESLVAWTNDLKADCILLLGDYVATHRFQTPTPMGDWARALARLRAPLGVHAVLGNHDWWMDVEAARRGFGLPKAGVALQEAGVKVYQNEAIRLVKDERPFWLVGLGDQLAFTPLHVWGKPLGIDDLKGALALADDDAPLILMAHEPDIFTQVPKRVALTISGHTHGGQINLLGWRPVVPSRYGSRFVYGHIIEDDRHLIVSGGLGCSGIPVRIGSPPEILLIDLGGAPPAA